MSICAEKMEGHYIVKLNYKCNANCLFCADTPQERIKEDPDFDNLIKDLKENSKRFNEIIISGGEPTIYKRFLDYLDHVKACGFKHVTISTNGFMLYYPSFTKKMIEKGVKQFVVSFQTTDKNTYHGLTGVKRAYELVTKGMQNAKKYGAWIAINTVIHKLNYKKLPEIVSYLIDFNVYNIQLSFLNPIGTSLKDGKSTMAVSFTEALPYIQRCFEIAAEKGYKKFFIENIPICIIPKYKERISDLKKADVNRDYYNACKTKPEKCKGCIHFNICDGVWINYLKQFGNEEIKPIKTSKDKSKEESDNSMAKMYNFPKKMLGFYGLYTAFFSDIAGLEEGFKKASIFNIKKSELAKTVSFFESIGYSCESSNFAYDLNNDKIVTIHSGFSDNSVFVVYVSRDPSICKELKQLDMLRFKNSSQTNISFNPQIRKGELLGHPKCCTKFISEMHTNPEYAKEVKMITNNSEYDLLHRNIALKKSKQVSYLLNHFNSTIPQMLGFQPCNYNCENAKKFVLKVINYIKKNNINHELIKKGMKCPLIFFSISECIVFEKAEKKGDVIFYSEPKYNTPAEKLFKIFKKGDSFKILDNTIEVFKKGELIEKIPRKNKFYGTFIEFE